MQQTDRPHIALLAGILGAAVGLTTILYGFWSNDSTLLFVRQVETIGWLGIVAVNLAMVFIFARPLWRVVRDLAPYRKGRTGSWLIAVIIFSLWYFAPPVLAAISDARPEIPIAGFPLRSVLLVVVAYVFNMLPAILGIWSIQFAIRDLITGAQLDDTQDYLKLRDNLVNVLYMLGLTIGAATLNVGALRVSVLEFYSEAEVTGVEFPELTVVLYGAFFTVLIAALYLPAYLSLQRAGANIRDHFFKLASVESPAEWKKSYDLRSDFESYLKLAQSPQEALRSGVAVISPLLTALISTLLAT